jgi:hypothetical protein
MLDVLVILFISVMVLLSNKRIAERYPIANRAMILRSWNGMFVFHFIFSCLFPLLPGDAIGYWNFGLQQIVIHSDKMFDYFGVGTVFLLFLDFIPVKVLGLSFFTGNFLYGVLGFLGMRYLFRLYIENLKVNVKVLGLPIIPYLFYLPNMNFWTAGVGKDTLCFFGIAWFLYALKSGGRRIIEMAISFALVFFVRPHVAMMILGGLAMSIVFSGNVKPALRFVIPVVVSVAFALLYKQVAAFLKVDDLNVKSVLHVASSTAILLGGNNSGSSVDISNYSIPARLVTYLYRPLFFDVHNFITLSSSFENLLYLVVSIKGIRAYKAKDIRKLPFWMVVGFCIFLLSVAVFSNSLSNLGIIMRMKNMTMIYFLFFCIWCVSERRAEELNLNRV